MGKLPPSGPIRFLSVERTVEEGLLIALTAVRMAVKNQIILGVLRNLDPYDAENYAEVARGQIALLVAENEGHASRFRTAMRAPVAPPALSEPDFGPAEAQRLETLEQVHTHLAVALRAVGEDDARIVELVESARQNAWDEIGDAWITRLTAQLPEPLDAGYARQRAGRLQEFVYIDLAGLVLDHERRRR
ncbi:hypothetical protein [Glaciihabitans tibetensis]|uniref:hypothetical protein n=1 Tax=Glaciihabitans tibetensis TaxID=1266600 RepID=UPI0015E64818|nr:hypothetical protein [Glaciihabitans tibetensis]